MCVKKIALLTTILIIIAQGVMGCYQDLTNNQSVKKKPLKPYIVFSQEQMDVVNIQRTLSGAVMLGIYEMTSWTSSGGAAEDWITKENDGICLVYSGKENWMMALIKGLYGDDFSQYQTLALELKGKTGGEYLSIGLIDSKGGSQEVPVANLTKQWKKIEIPLSQYRSKVNLSKLNGITSFLFTGKPQTVCFRKIEYLP